MKQLKAVIFDVDGTLAETEREGHRSSLNRAFKQAGLDCVWDEQRYGDLLAVTGGKGRLFYYLQQSHLTPDEMQKNKAMIPEIQRTKTALYTQAIRSGQLTLRPGLARLLCNCRQFGLKHKQTSHVRALLEANLGPQALKWFEVMAAGDVVEHKKPATDIFLYCLQQLGLNAAECIVIEGSKTASGRHYRPAWLPW